MKGYLESHYDLESSDVVSAIDELSLWSAPFGLRLLERVRYGKAIKALDVGSGLGFPLLELAMRLGKGSEVFGIDPWVAGVARASQKLKTYGITNVQVMNGRAEQLPFTSGFFDLVVSNNGINNVADLPQTLVEIARVVKTGAQFVFTFNTDKTFLPFYEVYRETLYDLGLAQHNKALREHIFAKRRPVMLMERLVKEAGFGVKSIQDDIFYYAFADGTAMLNHFFIKLAFLESWMNIVPSGERERVFRAIEERLNKSSKESGVLRMQVPFVTFDCWRR